MSDAATAMTGASSKPTTERFSGTARLIPRAAATLLLAFGISAKGGLAYVVAQATLSDLFLGISAVASTGLGVSSLAEGERGLASCLLNSAAQVGTALGIAVLFTLAAARTDGLAGSGMPLPEALVEGYRWAFFVAAGVAVLGAVMALALIRDSAKYPKG